MFWCVSSGVFGQVDQPARYEVDWEWRDVEYVVVNNQKQGITVVQPSIQGNASNSEYEIKFDHLGLELEKKWSGSFKISSQMDLIGYHYSLGNTYLLFQNGVNAKFIKLVSLNLEKQLIVVFETKELLEININYFAMVQNNAIIGGYNEERPVVFAYNPENGSVTTLENIYQPKAELAEIRVNRDSVTFNVLTSVFNDRKERTLEVHTYDYLGNYIRGYQILSEPEHQLLTGVSSSIMDKLQVVVGLYTTKNGSYPSGLYIHHVDRRGKQSIRYINFGEFDTFLDHLGERRAERLKDRARSKLESGRDWRYKTDVFFRPMIEESGKLIVLAEFYKPISFSSDNYNLNRTGFRKYSAFNPSRSDPFGQIDPSNFRMSNEFDFTHAFAVIMKDDGSFLSDLSFTINSQHEGYIGEYGGFQWHKEQVYYAYYHEKELIAGHLNATEPVEIGTKIELNEGYEEVKFAPFETFNFTSWYDNFVLVHGLQRIESEEKGGETKRVFFVNKVGFGPNFKNDEVKKE